MPAAITLPGCLLAFLTYHCLQAERTMTIHVQRAAHERLGIVLDEVRQASTVLPSPMLVAEVVEGSPAER